MSANKCYFSNNVHTLCLFCNFQKSKTTAKFCEKSRNKHHSNGLIGVYYHVYNCTVTVSYSDDFFLVFVFPADLLYCARLGVMFSAK